MTYALSPGEILAGKYQIERVLGRGGMGVVVAARHLQLEEMVAVKLMLPDVALAPDAVGRFVREARAAAKIQSEHVARVWDVGALDTGQPYMVMQYLEGCDLSALLARRGALPIEEAVGYLLQACEALAEAHAIGIVHRDLKPGNLFLANRRDASPIVKVLDFGISKVTGSAASQSDSAKTRTSALMGSPLYMSPEQMTSSRDVDARSDVWALGVILFELVAGRTPFDADTLPQVCAAILSGPTPSLVERLPDVPPEFERIIRRCLAKSAGDRYASISEFARALLPFAAPGRRSSFEYIAAPAVAVGEGALGRTLPAGDPSSSASVGAGTSLDFGKTTLGRSPRSRFRWLVVAALLAMSLLGAWLWIPRTALTTTHAAASEPEASAERLEVPIAANSSAPAPPVSTPASSPALDATPAPTLSAEPAAKPTSTVMRERRPRLLKPASSSVRAVSTAKPPPSLGGRM